MGGGGGVPITIVELSFPKLFSNDCGFSIKYDLKTYKSPKKIPTTLSIACYFSLWAESNPKHPLKKEQKQFKTRGFKKALELRVSGQGKLELKSDFSKMIMNQ